MTLWGGRFGSDPSRVLWDYTVDTHDRRLLPFDLRASEAHAAMLGATGIIPKAESDRIVAALAEIGNEEFEFLPTDEDVHSAIERRLIEKVGEVGEKLHTGRSRNDQVAVALRLYLRHAASRTEVLTRHPDRRPARSGRDPHRYSDPELHPSPTGPGHHPGPASPGSRLGACPATSSDLYRSRPETVGVTAWRRALGRVEPAARMPASTAQALGFDRPFANPMDAVGSRDLATEFAYVTTQALVDISRLAEELILWASSEFGWLQLDDAFATGSSALPQKKNPDIAELARGRGAVAIGRLTSLLALQKGLPLTYNRDLQEDKEAVFWLDDTLAGTCSAMAGLIATAHFYPPPPSHLTDALGIAENLVRRGIPFRSAHAAVGRLVIDSRWKAAGMRPPIASFPTAGFERSDLESQPGSMAAWRSRSRSPCFALSPLHKTGVR